MHQYTHYISQSRTRHDTTRHDTTRYDTTLRHTTHLVPSIPQPLDTAPRQQILTGPQRRPHPPQLILVINRRPIDTHPTRDDPVQLAPAQRIRSGQLTPEGRGQVERRRRADELRPVLPALGREGNIEGTGCAGEGRGGRRSGAVAARWERAGTLACWRRGRSGGHVGCLVQRSVAIKVAQMIRWWGK
jgi:hypothetical protein